MKISATPIILIVLGIAVVGFFMFMEAQLTNNPIPRPSTVVQDGRASVCVELYAMARTNTDSLIVHTHRPRPLDVPCYMIVPRDQ